MKRIALAALMILFFAASIADADTFTLAASVDDTRGVQRITGGSTQDNDPTLTYLVFGRWDVLESHYAYWTYVRFALDIPKGSTIDSSFIRFTCFDGAYQHTFNTTIEGGTTSGSPAWKHVVNGLGLTSYADNDALLAIARFGSVAWSPAGVATNATYDTPSLNSLLQTMVDSPDYDPTSATDKYVLFIVDDGSGNYDDDDMRSVHSWDGDPSKDAQLIVTYTPPSGGAQIIIIRR